MNSDPQINFNLHKNSLKMGGGEVLLKFMILKIKINRVHKEFQEEKLNYIKSLGRWNVSQ